MRLSLLCFFVLISFFATASPHTISGYIEDAETGEKLIAVNIFDLNSEQGTISNLYGFYSITLESDSVTLAFSYVGYQTQLRTFYLKEDITLNVQLQPEVTLQEVEIVAEKLKRFEESTQMSVIEVPIAQIKKIPALLGEVDVLKALQLLPGVQSGGEGQSGLYVRGGSPDQNLILLDGVPVYNASHLFGFFSVFNADAIKDVKLIKGGFPARYGGRLSSVLDITMKEGNNQEFHGTGSIGIVASKLTLEGPINKGKTSFIVSGRRTYIDLLARPLIKQGFRDNGTDGNTGYFFHDINAKVNHTFSQKDKLYVSMYTGKDRFYFRETEDDPIFLDETEAGIDWGNLTTTVRWNHLWTNKLFSNLTATYSQYEFGTLAKELSIDRQSGEEDRSEYRLRYDSGINDVGLKLDFDYLPSPAHFIRFGAGIIQHNFNPEAFDIDINEDGILVDTLLGQSNVSAQELALYIEDDWEVTDALKMNVGLHASGFVVNGEFYASLQPRFSARYLLGNRFSLKASFATMRQYVQLLSNEGIGLPTDLWLPTTDRVKPQDAWQAAIGAAKTYEGYEFSVEAYYKEMKNVLAYQEGSSLFQLDDWQDRVTQGNGTAYGLEFFVQKKTGQFTGWVGYTLAWATRQFPEVNFGRSYPYRYDRRHDLSIVGTYELTDRISFSAAWVFGSGNAVTLSNGRLSTSYPLPFDSFSTFRLDLFEERNNYRMRNYHRLDVSMSFSKQKRRYKRTWTIGAYNAYSRQNPFFIYLDNTFVNGREELELTQVSLFPIIPSVSWSFEF